MAQQTTKTWRVSPDMMCFFSAEGIFLSVNPAWQAVLGWTQEELEGRNFAEFVHPDDIQRSYDAFATLVGGTPVLKFENRYRASDGGYRWLSWVAVPEDDQYFCSARDITSDHQRVEQVETQKVEGELREQFLAVLGHDLRNPLAGLVSGISLLERRTSDAALTPILEQMRSSTVRMDELIRNMMDFARVRLGDGIGLETQHIEDIAARLMPVVEEIRLVSPGIELETDFDAGRPVDCDIARVQQVLSNLLANAVTHGDMTKPIRVAARTTDDRLIIEVANAGEKIDAETQANLFQPFFRVSPRESKQGLGLGLYISSEIVSAHGGDLSVSSDNDETRFTVSIPA